MTAAAVQRRAGFTLLELLLVLAILGIVFGIFGWNLLRSLRQNELRNAAAQLIADLRKSRSNAQQSGQVSTLELNTSKTSYATKIGSGTPQTHEVPHGVTIEPNTAGFGRKVEYQPPFGTLGATGVVWKVQSPRYADMKLFVKVVGITGKVMLSAAPD